MEGEVNRQTIPQTLRERMCAQECAQQWNIVQLCELLYVQLLLVHMAKAFQFKYALLTHGATYFTYVSR